MLTIIPADTEVIEARAGHDSSATADVYHDILIVASAAIGIVHESASWYSYRVAERLRATGVAVPDLTVRQILDAAEAERAIAADERDAPMGIGAL